MPTYIIETSDNALKFKGNVLRITSDDTLSLAASQSSNGDVTLTISGTGGVYTPTVTGVANTDAVTAAECQYLRVGNTVVVSGSAQVDPTAAATTRVGISLPVASNFGATGDCAGTSMTATSTSEAGIVYGDTANDRAEMWFTAAVTSNHNFYFMFAYQVI